MHVTKSVFESTISLFLDITGKMKDGLNAHEDLQALGIREELHPQEGPNGKVYLPPASYTLTNEEKRVICKCLWGIRVTIGFSANIKNLVFMSQLEMSGYNTHDCHTMWLLFLAIATIFEDGDHTDVPFLQCYIKEGHRCCWIGWDT
jgi:hypothetical protein